ncbi:uroporphyrin-3 C-methyltransferase [Halomonas campaniensis]|uniref:Uroporphyrin-3 C-methyltransferase n=1 Tax=Halomonas campaniensis TaxID=213554 RepID=A0A7W5PAH4_9GAMM|nr:uroporphyrinogen-III C-methyltransferase [Halomonas campaniensis]MBB3330799.1 uroporphyrin-3 C-methyltransferase [Halomonas campaniensis]
MSKQPHDQDEQQAPSGAQSATSGGGAGKGGASGRRRSRRYDKGGNATAADSPSAGQETAQPDRPAATAPAAGQSPSAETAGARPEEKAEKKPEATKAAAGPGGTGDARGGAGKGDDKGADKSADKPPAKPAGAAGSKSDTAKPDTAKSDTAKPAASASGGGPARPAAPAGGGDGKGKSGLVAIVLVILLAIAAALFGWQAWQKLDAQQARIAELESRTGELASAADLAGLEDRLDEGERERDAALEGAIQALQGEFADYRGEVNETLDQVLAELASEQETDERDWLHAEAAYLLRLANQRLQLERDVQGAAALLRTADQRLLEADNPALVPVRREIASELAALDAVPRVDRTGLWLALNAQQEQIARQPLAQEIEEITVRAGMEEAPTGTWQQQLSRFGQELKELVTIRHHDAALEALITPEQESYLRQSVRLVLEQSQLALLKEEQALFEASLDKALTLINGYYDTDASGVQSVIGRLEALKGEAIRPELPDISGSQQALATFIERRFESRRGDDA